MVKMVVVFSPFTLTETINFVVYCKLVNSPFFIYLEDQDVEFLNTIIHC